jgi:hypothetical protein
LAKHHYQETTFFAKALVQYQESTLVFAKHYSIKNQLSLGKEPVSRINFILVTHQYQEITSSCQSISIKNHLSLGKAAVSRINIGLCKASVSGNSFF